MTRRELVEREIERLHEQAAILERDWRRIPWLAAAVLSVGPAYWIWGPAAAFYAVLCVPCLVVTAVYLIGVRRSENRQLIEELEGQLRGMSAPDGTPASRPDEVEETHAQHERAASPSPS